MSNRYGEYGEKCPGISWSEAGGTITDDAIVFGDDTSGVLDEWPDTFIE